MSDFSLVRKKFPGFDPLARLKEIVESGALDPKDEVAVLIRLVPYWYPTLKAQEIRAQVKQIEITGNGMEFKT